jgi:hypothetical protein
VEQGPWIRRTPVSFVALAAIGISVATILLAFLGYRAMTFRADREENRHTDPREL